MFFKKSKQIRDLEQVLFEAGGRYIELKSKYEPKNMSADEKQLELKYELAKVMGVFK